LRSVGAVNFIPKWDADARTLIPSLVSEDVGNQVVYANAILRAEGNVEGYSLIAESWVQTPNLDVQTINYRTVDGVTGAIIPRLPADSAVGTVYVLVGAGGGGFAWAQLTGTGTMRVQP
jgi:hypothetical protein